MYEPWQAIRHFHISHNPLRLGGQANQTTWRTFCEKYSQFLIVMGKKEFCCATYCSNSRNKQPHLEYYRIPKEKMLREKWLSLIRRKDFRPSDSTRLCSEHFVGGKRLFEKDSGSYLPTIFKHKRNCSTKEH